MAELCAAQHSTGMGRTGGHGAPCRQGVQLSECSLPDTSLECLS